MATPPRAFDGYKLVRLLGRGGMGEVHLADDELLERQVAVKFISADECDAVARQRFLIEARAVARLQHPNVVSIYRVGEVDGIPYLVSEYVRGQTLDQIDLPAPTEQVQKIALSIANGLAAAHARGVIHRDIKPANTILTDNGETKLLDFGIAKMLTPSGPPGETPRPAAQSLPVSEEQESTSATVELRPRPRSKPTSKTAVTVHRGPKKVAVTTARTVSLAPARGPAPERAVAVAHQATVASPCALSPELAPTQHNPCPPEPATPVPAGVHSDRADHSSPDIRGASLTIPGAVMGTPAFMAPEGWRGEPPTFHTDIYSLGALLYTLCVGNPPHTAESLEDLSDIVRNQDASALAQVAPDIDSGLGTIIDRCLRRDPAERFASGNHLREALVKLSPGHRDSPVPEGNPYRGLYAFGPEHHNVFFGRDSEVRMILERLQSTPFVLVAGDSGVGKSSVCRAGVLPSLAQVRLENRSWTVVTVLPSRSPVASLAAALAPILQEDERALITAMEQDPSSFSRQLRGWHGAKEGLLLFIDQMEEIVTLANKSEAVVFAELLRWLSEPGPSIRVLGTIRGDFLSRLAALPPLTQTLSSALYFLRPLSEERIREAIAGPALAKGVSFDPPELVDVLVSSAETGGGSLPLLQFALAELWEARSPQSSSITQDDFDAIGGVAGTLSRHADNVINGMPQNHRSAAKTILLKLVTPDATRNSVDAVELCGDSQDAQAAIAALTAGRLTVARETTDGPAYEIAHEALLSGWDTIANWLGTDSEARRVHDHLRRNAQEWDRLNRPGQMLWSEPQLAETALLHPKDLSSRERTFLRASRSIHRRSRVVRWSLAATVVLLAVGIWQGLQWRNRRLVRHRADASMKMAMRSLKTARAARMRALVLRQQALTLFDQPATKAAERLWTQYLAVIESAIPHYQKASQAVETALLLQRNRTDVRDLFAQVLYERAVFAQLRQNHDALEELLRRLALYDHSGALRRAWRAPARLTLKTEPSQALLTLYRYTPDKRGVLGKTKVREGRGALTERDLPPGSYLLVIRSPGYSDVRYPVHLSRGESHTRHIELPRASKIPKGFVYIPPGEFLYGSAAQNSVRRDFFHTVPIHRVATGGYVIAKHETTFAQWMAFVQALSPDQRKARLPRVNKGGFQGALSLKQLAGDRWQITMQPTIRRYVAPSDRPIVYAGRRRLASQNWLRFPVVGITAADAQAYTAWLHTSGRLPNARLCSEIEWERAARGGDGREYPHGATLGPTQANFDDTYSKVPERMGPDEVGSHPASRSPFGLDDMAGNVWEWTRSSHAPNQFVARGGSWYFGANSSRTMGREVTEPSFRDMSVGFRVCADLLL
jgi:eukaryotic-like serine/threonine-protein kinase